MAPVESPPTSWTKMRCPLLSSIAAVLSFGTPMMLRLKCVPLGAPFPVVVTEAVVRFELDVVVVVVLLDVVDVGDVAVPVTADVTLVAALWTVFAAAVAADV